MNGFRTLIPLGTLIFLALCPNPVQAQEEKMGIRSRFSFAFGGNLGFGDQASAGIIGGVRFMGVAGADIEYDFNRVAETPLPTSRKVSDLHFVPNLRLGGTVYFYRKKRYATFATGGLGIDLGTSNRVNLFAGSGIEITFVKDRITLCISLRFYFPRPVDVEKQREQLLMEGKPSLPAYTDYYNFDTYQLNFAVKIVY
ncbi:hypothetical protein KKF84_11505 [Myxococcota bacterium]|nr:hypothetical protein [Myxococcota bacterium]MBU1535938.1 hypothetical protein [Myxococcota bacterium]